MKSLDTELQVVIPYNRLVELLEAANRVNELRSEVAHIKAMYDSLQSRFTELCIQFKDLKS